VARRGGLAARPRDSHRVARILKRDPKDLDPSRWSFRPAGASRWSFRPAGASRAGDRIVSVSRESLGRTGSARLWDAASGECLEVIEGSRHTEAIDTALQPFPLRAVARGLETVVERVDSDTPVAWFPAELGKIAPHSAGRGWGGAIGSYLCLVTLEGGDGST
jgi:hypothetical protein